MATVVELKDYTDKILSSFERKANTFLLEVKESISSQASINSPIDTGNLSRSFLTDSFVNKSEKTAYIGSSLKYSVWQEFGTGEYALERVMDVKSGGYTNRKKTASFIAQEELNLKECYIRHFSLKNH